jgi:hypothetical protein
VSTLINYFIYIITVEGIKTHFRKVDMDQVEKKLAQFKQNSLEWCIFFDFTFVCWLENTGFRKLTASHSVAEQNTVSLTHLTEGSWIALLTSSSFFFRKVAYAGPRFLFNDRLQPLHFLKITSCRKSHSFGRGCSSTSQLSLLSAEV